MKTEQSGSTNDPISVDDQFLRSLGQIIGEINELGVDRIASKHKVDREVIKQIARGEIPEIDVTDPKWAGYDEETRTSLENLSRQQKITLISDDLERYTSVSYNLSYQNGYTFQTKDFDQLQNILETEADTPESLTVSAGGWSNSNFRLTLSSAPFSGVARYAVEGTRNDVEHLVSRLRNLLRASEPEHSWLHRKWPEYAVTTAIIASFIWAYLLMIAQYQNSLSEDARGGLLAIIAVPAFAGFLASRVPVKRLRRAFPMCQFEFGPEKRRRGTYRSLWWAMVTVFAIPAILAIAFG